MTKHVTNALILLIATSTAAFLLFVNLLVSSLEPTKGIEEEYSWLIRGVVNVLGYSTLLIPGYLVYKYLQRINYSTGGTGCLSRILVRCFYDSELIGQTTPSAAASSSRTALQDGLLLLYYFTGLQVSFLCWGVLQEKVMTQEYLSSSGKAGRFEDSQFLVFVNRVLAVFASGAVILYRRERKHACPLYKYAYCSLSNILSSWCQYEALKYVSFLHQVLTKASKVLPVMIMGKVVARARYEFYEYLTAILLFFGMTLFMLGADNVSHSITTTVSGAVLLCLYILFDSFTSNFQSVLFKRYSMSPVQMMCGVNFFSCTFTFISLLQQGNFSKSLDFMLEYPSFISDCLLLSLSSATGQLFIFSTIATFGPVIFAIISTTRQACSVLLSCIIYDHKVSTLGVLGIVLVFFSLLLRTYCGYRKKSLRKLAAEKRPIPLKP